MSNDDVNTTYMDRGGYLAFGRGSDALMVLSATESRARQTGQGEVLWRGVFNMDATDSSARKEAVRDGAPPIELVDGEKLASMLEKLELGLRPRQTFEVDATFFDEYKK